MPTASRYPERETLRGFFAEIFRLVLDNATPKQWADWLRVPVEHAAAQGNLELVTALLKAGGTGASGLRGCRGRTLLDAAAEGGNEKVVSAILKAGARPDLSVRSGSKRRSALHRAALHGHEDAARVLMMAGSDVGSLDADKRGPLALAIRGGHEGLACSLLLGGACPSAKDRRGDSPLHLAAWRGRAGIASALLLKGADKDALDSLGRTPLIVAAEHEARGTADALLMANADTAVRYGENELSSLDSAASHGHVGVLKALVRHGIDVNDADSTGYTALHMAADNNRSNAIDVLIDAGADIESQDVHQWTPLHCAARYNSCYEVVLALLRRGAKINARESAGEYPIHVAALYSADRVVDLLLRWGADETKANGDGHTPVEVIGTYASDGEPATSETERRQGEERTRRLLVGAPADRAWRRRSCVVLCRNRIISSEKPPSIVDTCLQEGQDTQEGQEGERQRRRGRANTGTLDTVGKHPAAKVARVEGGEENEEGGGRGSETTVAATADAVAALANNQQDRVEIGGQKDASNRDYFVGVCFSLVKLAEEEIFREIVGFL